MIESLSLRKLAIPAITVSIGLGATACTAQTAAVEHGIRVQASSNLPTPVHPSAAGRYEADSNLKQNELNPYVPGEKSFAGCKPSTAWYGVYRPVSDEKDVTVRELDTYAKALNVPPSRVLGGTVVRIVCNSWDEPLFLKQHAAFTEWLAGDICLLTKPIAKNGVSEAICPERLGL